MKTTEQYDEERARLLLDQIDAVSPNAEVLVPLIMKAFEEVRDDALARYMQAIAHNRVGSDFDQALNRHREQVAQLLQHNDPIAEAVWFLLAVAHQPVPGGVVEVGGESPRHQYERCKAVISDGGAAHGAQCIHLQGHAGPHES